MEQTKDHMKKGGAFLIEEVTADQLFTPEDFTDEHKMIAKTTEDYILGDVLPYIDEIEEHNFEHSVRLLKKPANSGFSVLTFLRSMADSDLIKSARR